MDSLIDMTEKQDIYDRFGKWFLAATISSVVLGIAPEKLFVNVLGISASFTVIYYIADWFDLKLLKQVFE